MSTPLYFRIKPQWRKVAMIRSQAGEQYAERALPLSYEVIAARIRTLADSDQIEAAGDLRKWRFGEGRLKP